MSGLVLAGLVPHCYLLSTRGRVSGLRRRNPIILLEQDGRHWLVAPYGPVGWVLNARADGCVTLRRRARAWQYAVREVGPAEAGVVLQCYLGVARAARPYFWAHMGGPVGDFVAEAHLHPVFELTALNGGSAPTAGEISAPGSRC